jgi:hypothetical protein
MNKFDRTSAIGLARYARDYYDAALAADDVLGKRKGYEIVAPAPVMFLVAHSIELALKSFLRFRGFTIDDLKKLSHRLDECWRVAKENGIEEHVTLTEDDLGVLSLISDLHASTELRYIQTGFKTFPVFGPLQVLTDKLLNCICPLVGYR